MQDKTTKPAATTETAAARARRLAESLYDAVIAKGGDHTVAGEAARRLEASMLRTGR